MIYASSLWASTGAAAAPATDGVTPTIRRYRYLHHHGWLLAALLGRRIGTWLWA